MTDEHSQALVPVVIQPSTALLPTSRELDLVERAAAMVYAGGVSLPKELNTKEKVAAVMLYGLELGLKPMTAIQHLYLVNGKVSASAQVMAGMCMSKERDIEFHVEQSDAVVCTIRMIRPSRNVNEPYTVTWEQIKRAGLDKNPMNSAFPEDRLRYHCTKRLCRTYAPDLINGLDEGVSVPGVSDGGNWRELPIDPAEFYNEGDAPRLTEAVQAPPRPTPPPSAPQPHVEGFTPVAMLAAIEQKNGLPAKQAAISVMARLFGTSVLTKLDEDQRDEYGAMLAFRLNDKGHDHELAYTANGVPICSRCGDQIPEPEEAPEPVQAGFAT